MRAEPAFQRLEALAITAGFDFGHQRRFRRAARIDVDVSAIAAIVRGTG